MGQGAENRRKVDLVADGNSAKGNHWVSRATHRRRGPSITSATGMRVKSNHAANEKNWLKRPINRTEKRRCREKTLQVLWPDPRITKRLRDHNHLSGRKTLVQLAQSGHLATRWEATQGMSYGVLLRCPSIIKAIKIRSGLKNDSFEKR